MHRRLLLFCLVAAFLLPLAPNARALAEVDNSADAYYAKQKEFEKKYYEDQQASNMRFRARELQNQIYWWKQQFGQGQYDDDYINGAIDSLQYELNGIPRRYR